MARTVTSNSTRSRTAGRADSDLNLKTTPAPAARRSLVPSQSFTGAFHLESCTPGQDWANRYILVRTNTYRYNTVQGSTRISKSYVLVCTAAQYRYIPVRTLKKTSCFLTHPERFRRDKIEAVQLLCMGYNVAKLNFKTTQV